MEWIDGTKLTDVQANSNPNDVKTNESVKENLELVKVAIDSTLSQLLVTGILHADPHAGMPTMHVILSLNSAEYISHSTYPSIHLQRQPLKSST